NLGYESFVVSLNLGMKYNERCSLAKCQMNRRLGTRLQATVPDLRYTGTPRVKTSKTL
ncbi:hypothetical protein HAX54_036243, partial [Datura stramonium]|nr:hypothetical protein [Datura stramonium]